VAEQRFESGDAEAAIGDSAGEDHGVGGGHVAVIEREAVRGPRL
jgi:hypothetical protein